VLYIAINGTLKANKYFGVLKMIARNVSAICHERNSHIMLYSGRRWNTWWTNDIYCLYTDACTSKLARLSRIGHENVVQQDQPCNTRRLLFRKLKCEVADWIFRDRFEELLYTKGDSFCRNTVTRGDIAGCFFVPWRSESSANARRPICIL